MNNNDNDNGVAAGLLEAIGETANLIELGAVSEGISNHWGISGGVWVVGLNVFQYFGDFKAAAEARGVPPMIITALFEKLRSPGLFDYSEVADVLRAGAGARWAS